ncbi:hypothetical protein E9232_004886 [Inquilinus ginsengisoli]|uniref:Uncharacterized protein n=1 Tax=Inquilinus ginsengisoli TaxID=363840 RepID=A0ABU1JUQ8_9PROT|nr:hypothetical protein [Inquilinus ginsengisoli]MDR6292346.1 hypothetical protein [Inquilinus ginsengisoli]
MAGAKGLLQVQPTPVMGGLLGVPGSDDVAAGPPDLSDRYNTQLAAEDEAAFAKWLAQLSKSKGYDASQDLADYDLRGAWRSGAKAAANGHLPDTYKKPNHPTFSEESQYSSPDTPGGKWVQNGKAWEFAASPFNLRMTPPEALQAYFARAEPESRLRLPEGVQPTPVGLLGARQ